MKTHPLTQLQVRRGMRLSIFDGMLAQAFYGLTWPGSVFVTGFALLLGAGSFTIGLLAALPPLLSGVNLLAAWALERVGRRRRFFAATSGIHRSVILLFMVIPFAAGTASRPALLWLLIGVIFVSVFFGAFQHTAWMSWMADMIPEDRRGAFFSRRNMLCGGLWMVQSYAIGQLLTRQNTELTYALVFAAATLLAVPSILLVTAQPEPPLETDPDRPSLIDLWRHAWNLKQFRWFLFFQLAWGFTTSLAGPFYNVYMLQNLGIPIGQITAWGVVWGIVSTATVLYWGMLGDRAGNKPTLLFSLLGSCATAFGWLLVTKANMSWLLPLIFGLSGFFDTGVGLIAFNTLLGVVPEKNKPSYLALYETIVGTFAGVAPLLGGVMAESLPALDGRFMAIGPVFAVIVASTVLRVFPLFLAVKMPIRQETGFGFVMKEFVLTNPFKLFTNLHFIDKSADRKLSAIDNLTDMKSKAALPDLVRSMHDLDPRVRQRAVQALGEIGDRRAAAHLVAALDDPLEDLRAEAAEALGRLGDRSAIGPLVNKLDSGDMHMVRCAITALGELQAAEAAPKIAALLNVTGNTGLLLACADALGRLRCFESIEPLLRVTRLTQNAPVKRSLVASVGRLVDDDGDLYRALSEQELHYHAAAREILGPRTVRLARDPHSSLRQNVNNAYKASTEYNFNEAVLEMKVINLNAVLEFLSDKNLKRLFGFDKWVRLLDADYATQVEAVYRIDRDTGVALAVVDYYARHCPTSSEPDMDQQEFLLALYAFRAGQAGLNRLIYEKPPMTDTVTMRLGDFSRRFDDDETGRSEQ